MRHRVPGMLLLLSLISGCGPTERKIPGLLDERGLSGDALYRSGDRLYYAFGDRIYSLDASDPRRMRETDSDAWGDVVCPDACPGYFWQDGHVFTVGAMDSEVAKVSLPNGSVPVWVFAPPAYDETFTMSSVRLSDDLIALAQWSYNAGDDGRLLVVRINPSPAVVGSLDIAFNPLLTAAVHSSGFLFSSTNMLSDNYFSRPATTTFPHLE